MNALRTVLPTFAAALLAAGCATTATTVDTSALAASIESIGHWSASAPPSRPGVTAAAADRATSPVVSQAARR
jgi:hypothetical protein